MVLKRLVILTLLLLLLSSGFPSAALAEGFDTHSVRAGETLATIAAQHGITTQALVVANNISNPDLVRVGQKLSIPRASGSIPAPKPDPAPAHMASLSSYAVRPGQTLSQIAVLFGVSAAAIAQANGIENADLIRPGQELIIPQCH